MLRIIVAILTTTLLLSSCSGKQETPTKTEAVDQPCLPEGDPKVQYFSTSEDECMGTVKPARPPQMLDRNTDSETTPRIPSG